MACIRKSVDENTWLVTFHLQGRERCVRSNSGLNDVLPPLKGLARQAEARVLEVSELPHWVTVEPVDLVPHLFLKITERWGEIKKST